MKKGLLTPLDFSHWSTLGQGSDISKSTLAAVCRVECWGQEEKQGDQ